MLVTITLLRRNLDGEADRILAVWTIPAPSVRAMERLIAEDLGPTLRRMARRMILARPWTGPYDPQEVDIVVEPFTGISLNSWVRELAAEDPMCPRLTGKDLRRRSPAGAPASAAEALRRHGYRNAAGKRCAYRRRSILPPEPPLPFDEPVSAKGQKTIRDWKPIDDVGDEDDGTPWDE